LRNPESPGDSKCPFDFEEEKKEESVFGDDNPYTKLEIDTEVTAKVGRKSMGTLQGGGGDSPNIKGRPTMPVVRQRASLGPLQNSGGSSK